MTLIACSSKTTPQSATSIADEDFKYKQECQKYVKDIEERLDKEEIEESTIYKDVNISLEEIFYSRTGNSCIYTVTERYWFDGEIYEPRWIVDALTNVKTIYNGIYKINTPEWQKGFADFRSEVSKLKFREIRPDTP